MLIAAVGPDGSEQLPARFLDWATNADTAALVAGTHALLRMGLTAGADLSRALEDEKLAGRCEAAAAKMAAFRPPAVANQQANALRVLAGLADAGATNAAVFAPNPTLNLSPFYGYYVLEARAAAGDVAGGLELLRHYWGGMIDFGATSFWEHFDAAWLSHQPAYTRVDEWPVPGRPNVHEDTGAYCYKGFRHSLCHGWSAGPCAWLARHVLGVTPTAAGFARVRIDPHLASLECARGTVPTPTGAIIVEHRAMANGKVDTKVTLPDGVSRD